MVNFGLNSASILGIFLAVAGASLYFLRSVRPELSRDHDIFFAAVGLLCGFILLFQGWRLDPILQFGQFLLTGSTIFFAVESIRLRKVATEQARRNTPTVDRERPVSRTRVYREEEFEREPGRSIPDAYNNVYEGAAPNYDSPQLRGYDEPQPRSPRPRSLRDEEPRPRTRPRPDRYADPTVEPTRRRSKNVPPRSNTRDNYDVRSRQNSWDEPDYPKDTRSPAKSDRISPRNWDAYPEEPFPSPSIEERRPNPNRRPKTDLEKRERYSRSYSNEDLGTSYDEGLGTSYEEDLGNSYEDDRDVIATDYVEYQPLENLGSDYDDEDEENRDEYRDEEIDRRDDRRYEKR
jgi:hypothetical protein